VRYQIIAAPTLGQLEAMVNNEMRHGWEVTGGLTSYVLQTKEMLSQPEQWLAQAMIQSTPQPA
jgi:hypothetical protein